MRCLAMFGLIHFIGTLCVTLVLVDCLELPELTCEESLSLCENDAKCAHVYANASQVCSHDQDCSSACGSLLHHLSSHAYFSNCTCPKDSDSCNKVKIFVTSHPCLKHELSDSCISIRRRCLQNSTCKSTLAQFWRYCRDSKRRKVCASNNSAKCYTLIHQLANTGIFDCKCHMKKEQALKRCKRIHYRMVNNRCLVEVPYVMFSSRQYLNFSQILEKSNMLSNPSSIDATDARHTTNRTCLSAFERCLSDTRCRSLYKSLVSQCSWSPSRVYSVHDESCDHVMCREAIRNFYLLSRPELTQDLFFCRCDDAENATEPKQLSTCQSIMDSLRPTCSSRTNPVPQCHLLLDSCLREEDCRIRLDSFTENCGSTGGVCNSSPQKCRSAFIRLQGTRAATNCTCYPVGGTGSYDVAPLDDLRRYERCIQARATLSATQSANPCKDTGSEYISTTPIVDQVSWKDDSINNKICKRKLAENIPPYLDVPEFIRTYPNTTDSCSSICTCSRDGQLKCNIVQCNERLSCRRGERTYGHGSAFMDEERGQCRCIKGELVCSKTLATIKDKPGLFLHVGYSVVDQYLVEANSNMKFQAWTVTDKLAAMVNGDSAVQFCVLSLFSKHIGNLVFEIKTTKHDCKYNSNPKVDHCTVSTKQLSNDINERSIFILTDAELSLLKVAQLERVSFHSTPEGRDLRPLYTSSSSSSSGASAVELLVNSWNNRAFTITLALAMTLAHVMACVLSTS